MGLQPNEILQIGLTLLASYAALGDKLVKLLQEKPIIKGGFPAEFSLGGRL